MRQSLQVRIDTRNVLNHPEPGGIGSGPNLAINLIGANAFGSITNKTGQRSFQRQVRLNF